MIPRESPKLELAGERVEVEGSPTELQLDETARNPVRGSPGAAKGQRHRSGASDGANELRDFANRHLGGRARDEPRERRTHGVLAATSSKMKSRNSSSMQFVA